MSRKTSARFAQPKPSDNSFAGDLPPVGDLNVTADNSTVPLNRQLVTERTATPKASTDLWQSMDDDLPPVDEPEKPKKPNPATITLASCSLEELPQQWDAFMESLPRRVADKIYDANYRTITQLHSTPKSKLLAPRGPFTQAEFDIVAARFVQLGHPLHDEPAKPKPRRTTAVGEPIGRGVGSDALAERREQLRAMRRD